MGIFGGDSEPSQGEELINEQLATNKKELEAKKASLFKTRLDIIKSQGGENWTPETGGGIPSKKTVNTPANVSQRVAEATARGRAKR